ncbi:RNA-binding transcriptional accessory protein [Erysipelotrichaceae bacterium OttesenSCG-928-M19]|nr:RNA-binding transcriptional accessory protein [Erysipelotrichaceae bacterium OttesenSCG-928-M19]
MNEKIITEVATQLKISPQQVSVVLDLLAENNTIPFIARYRKEATKGLDENTIFEINKHYEYQENLLKRKEDVIRLIDEKGMLNEEIRATILKAEKIVEVDNIYQPYKDKKKTKASIAISLGLEPLALALMNNHNLDVNQEAKKYLNDDVQSIAEAINYALDIVAQITCDNSKVREFVLENIHNYAYVVAKEKKKHDDEQQVFKMYYDFNEKFDKIANHRILGLNRAIDKKVVTMSFELKKDYNVENIYRYFFSKKDYVNKDLLYQAIEDGYKRLLFPSIVRQLFSLRVEQAGEDAIDVFAKNIENLLLSPPLKDKVILGFDPAFRTGCKLAVIDKNGSLLDIGICYPHEYQNQIEEAKKIVLDLVNKYQVDIIAIGNGTASRESEMFIADLIKEFKLNVSYAIVSESGASVYSASKIAQEEFKDLKVEQRSAISIARRLLDPLGELIKIDPKSIGVGQYQHDVNQKELANKLDFTVDKIVNEVGVDINTASSYLLRHISGLNKGISESIINYRQENKRIENRRELLKIAKLGPKAFEQAAGFLRIVGGNEILDQTTIHPESYQITYQILENNDLKIEDINSTDFKNKLKQIDSNKISTELKVDSYTINDILQALQKPNLDVRDELEKPKLRSDVLKLEDLQVGMELEGVVRNVVDFGVFVDIGLKNDALLHISKISNTFIKHPSEKLSVNDIIKVNILEIDQKRQNVALTMLNN